VQGSWRRGEVVWTIVDIEEDVAEKWRYMVEGVVANMSMSPRINSPLVKAFDERRDSL
jgi:hypothetical protein